MNIETMTRQQLILETFAGSVIATANFQTFNWRKAIAIILQDEELTNEVCADFNLTPAILKDIMTATVNEEIALAIGAKLEATMNEDIILW